MGAGDWLDSLWNQRQVLNDKVAILAWGGKDIAFGEKDLQTWSEAFPKARVMRFPKSGHFVSEENSAELSEAIKGLDMQPGKA